MDEHKFSTLYITERNLRIVGWISVALSDKCFNVKQSWVSFRKLHCKFPLSKYRLETNKMKNRRRSRLDKVRAGIINRDRRLLSDIIISREPWLLERKERYLRTSRWRSAVSYRTQLVVVVESTCGNRRHESIKVRVGNRTGAEQRTGLVWQSGGVATLMCSQRLRRAPVVVGSMRSVRELHAGAGGSRTRDVCHCAARPREHWKNSIHQMGEHLQHDVDDVWWLMDIDCKQRISTTIAAIEIINCKTS